MIAVAYLIWGFILAVVIAGIALAVTGGLDRGDRAIEEAMAQMENARRVTGRTRRRDTGRARTTRIREQHKRSVAIADDEPLTSDVPGASDEDEKPEAAAS